ncbi:MAG: DUF1861 family protein [bacterium]|nr:DUF1861 family protein [bacterium]
MEQNIEKEKFSPPNCAELLQKFKEKKALPPGKKLLFSGVGENDVYNISAPFRIGNKTVISGRVEAREATADSHIVFFEEKKGVWVPTKNAPKPPLALEDGFATHIGDETIFGGVEVYPSPTATDSRRIGYRTALYRGHDLPSLQKFAVGPDMMKNIRLVLLTNGRIGVFTRPQEGSSGRGKIGYTELSRLEDLNAENILNARIIENQFVSEEWGGADELHPLEDGEIGIIGHIASQDREGLKHYYAMSFVYDPKTHQASPIEIIATRKNFPQGEAKTQELADIVLPGGYDRKTATLYAGLSDAEAGSISLPDPFLKLKK